MDEFSDVFPEGLPPLRDIQHLIDLVPSSSLPNSPHYRISLEEDEELKHQAKALFSEAHIRESLSCCIVNLGHGGCVDTHAINMIEVK